MASSEKGVSNHRVPTHHDDNESDSGDEQWADAHEEIAARNISDAPTTSPSITAKVLPETEADQNEDSEFKSDNKPRPRAEYPLGRDPEEKFTDAELQALIEEATKLKNKGNDAFRDSNWDLAEDSYKQALRRLPARTPQHPSLPNKESNDPKGKGKALDDDDDGQAQLDALKSAPKLTGGDQIEDVQGGNTSPPPELSPLEKECATMRSVLNNNIAACYVKKGNHAEAIKFCSEALMDEPQYAKALLRRAASNEEIGSWNSMASAEKDYQLLLTILPPSSPSRSQVVNSLRTLPSRIELAKTKETDEMLGKLKDLGNTVLGKFGLSTNNFQFTPNGSGGYSMNFVK